MFLIMVWDKNEQVMKSKYEVLEKEFDTLAEAMAWELLIQATHPDYRFSVYPTL